MSFWQRLRDAFSGPMHVGSGGDDSFEVQEDLNEEMPEAAEDAEETAEAESVAARGGFVQLTPDPTLPLPTTLEFEHAQEAASEDAEAADRSS